MKELLFILLLALAAKGKGEVGVSYFAMPGFDANQCKIALRAFNGVKRPFVAILWKTFGSDESGCLQRFFNIQRKKTLEIHPTNETCRRPPRYCADGEINRQYKALAYNRALEARNPRVLRQIRRRALEIWHYLLNSPVGNTELIISTGLEDNFTNDAFDVVLEQYKSIFGNSVKYVRSGVRQNEDYFVNSHFLEFHGLLSHQVERFKRRCIYNFDGVDFEFPGRRLPELRPHVHRAEVLSAIRRAREHRCKVALWWGGPQGSNFSRFVEPRRRHLIVRRDDVRIINKILKEMQK